MTEQNPPKFYYPVHVRFADTDLQGHMYFANYFTFMDEAFLAYLRALNHSWDRLAKMGLGIYYIDCGYQFKGQAFVEDTLHVHTAVTRLGNTSLKVDLTILRFDSEQVIGTGFIAGIMVDATTGQSVRIPDAFREAVARYQDRRP